MVDGMPKKRTFARKILNSYGKTTRDNKTRR